MIEIPKARDKEIASASPYGLHKPQDSNVYDRSQRKRIFWQMLRFCLVGGVNTLVDLLILNALLLLLPTSNSFVLLAYNALTYGLGAINSFLMNKYWTFGNKQRMARAEVLRFALTTLFGIVWSCGIVWLVSNVLHPFLLNATVWANVSKVFAIAGTALISYLGMRLWVFVNNTKAR